MPDEREQSTAAGAQGGCLAVTLQKTASNIKTSDGRELSFARAVLTMENRCGAEVTGVSPHATLGQEGGTVQDVSAALTGSGSSVPAGGALTWDVYDLLLPAHPGTASKVHMFGYRAALNWRFELAVWAEYRPAASSDLVRTPVARWALQWTVPDPAAGAVELNIEKLAD